MSCNFCLRYFYYKVVICFVIEKWYFCIFFSYVYWDFVIKLNNCYNVVKFILVLVIYRLKVKWRIIVILFFFIVYIGLMLIFFWVILWVVKMGNFFFIYRLKI